MSLFSGCYSKELEEYYALRSTVLSESARSHELCYLKRFDKYTVSKNLDAGKISEDDISEWIGTLQGKSSTVGMMVITVRMFLKYLRTAGYDVYLPVIPKIRDDYVPYIFSDDELDTIFAAADNLQVASFQTNPYIRVEFPVIIRLLYSCGLRIGETVRLHVSDVDFESGTLLMTQTKGNKQRIVPMNPDMTEILRKYCMFLGIAGKSESWLFPSECSDRPVSHKAVKRYFEVTLARNGINSPGRRPQERGPCMHCLRHVFAFRSFRNAERDGRSLFGEIPFLSIYLGHYSLDETEKYLKFSSEMFPEAFHKFEAYMEDLLPEVDYET